MSRVPEPRAPRRPARRAVNWRRAAELLGQGLTVAQAAARVGCSRSALVRKRRHHSKFQGWMASAREGGAHAQAQRFEGSAPDGMDKAITREVGSGNVLDVAAWDRRSWSRPEPTYARAGVAPATGGVNVGEARRVPKPPG